MSKDIRINYNRLNSYNYMLLFFITISKESASTFESIILNTFKRIVEQQLSALMVGSALMLLILIKYWEVPKKWSLLNERIIRLDKRQKKIYYMLKASLKHDKSFNFNEIENDFDFHDDEDDE